MPLFILNARDKVGALDIRMANRPAHLKWAKGFADKIQMAGPVFAEDGETFAGSVIVIEMDTLKDAQAWATNDPYAKAGLFETVEIKHFSWLIGDGPNSKPE